MNVKDGHHMTNCGWRIEVLGPTKEEIHQILQAVPPKWARLLRESLERFAAMALVYNRAIAVNAATIVLVYGSGSPVQARGRQRPWNGIEVVVGEDRAVISWDDRRTTPIVIPDVWYNWWDPANQKAVGPSVAVLVDGGAVVFVPKGRAENAIERLQPLRTAALAAIRDQELPALTADNALSIAHVLGGRVA